MQYLHVYKHQLRNNDNTVSTTTIVAAAGFPMPGAWPGLLQESPHSLSQGHQEMEVTIATEMLQFLLFSSLRLHMDSKYV